MREYQELAECETPIYKIKKRGAEALSKAELILLILNAGDKNEDLRKRSRKISSGVYPEALEALDELTRRDNIKSVHSIKSASDIFERLKFSIALEKQEHFVVFTLDGASNVISQETVFVGTLNQSLVHPREIFSLALKDCAAGIIIAHNHPSGTLKASRADISLTQRISEAGSLMGIELLDHVIITEDGYYSFSDEGMM